MTEDLREMVSMRAWAQEFVAVAITKYHRTNISTGKRERVNGPAGESSRCNTIETRYDVLVSLSEAEAHDLVAFVAYAGDNGADWSWGSADSLGRTLGKALTDIAAAKNPPQSNDSNPSFKDPSAE